MKVEKQLNDYFRITGDMLDVCSSVADETVKYTGDADTAFKVQQELLALMHHTAYDLNALGFQLVTTEVAESDAKRDTLKIGEKSEFRHFDIAEFYTHPYLQTWVCSRRELYLPKNPYNPYRKYYLYTNEQQQQADSELNYLRKLAKTGLDINYLEVLGRSLNTKGELNTIENALSALVYIDNKRGGDFIRVSTDINLEELARRQIKRLSPKHTVLYPRLADYRYAGSYLDKETNKNVYLVAVDLFSNQKFIGVVYVGLSGRIINNRGVNILRIGEVVNLEINESQGKELADFVTIGKALYAANRINAVANIYTGGLVTNK